MDDEAAAEQLEEELEERVEAAGAPSKQASHTKKGGRPAKKAAGKAAATPAIHDNTEQTAADEEDNMDTLAGKNYWLMKAEQEDREEVLSDGSTVSLSDTRQYQSAI